MSLGFAGIASWPTYTTPGVVPYGILLALIFVVPGKARTYVEKYISTDVTIVGIIKAMVRAYTSSINPVYEMFREDSISSTSEIQAA